MEAIGVLILRWVLAVFATYRVARMLTLEEGPFSLFDRFRDAITDATRADSWLSRGVACPYCAGWWVAFLLMLYVWNGLNLFEAFILWASIAGGAAYLQATEGEP